MVLPAPFGPGEQDDLTGRRIEVDSGERRETPEEADGGAATDDGRHSRLRDSPPRIRRRRVYGRWPRAVEPATPAPRSVGVSLAAHAPGARSRRTRARDRRAPAPPVRGLPALGHRHLPGPGPERPPAAVRAGAASGRATTTTDHHRLRPPTTTHGRTIRSSDHHAGPVRGTARGRRGRPHRHPQDRRRPVRGRGRERRRPAQGARALPEHADARATRATARSPVTAPPTATPFGDLDQLGAGDEIRVDHACRATSTTRSPSRRVVDPSEVSVLDPSPDPTRPGHQLATLTLTTCNPKYSAEQRLIIRAQLELPAGQTAPLPPTKVEGGKQGHHHRRTVGRVVVAQPGDPLGDHRARRSGCSGGCCSTVTRAGPRGSSAWSRSSPRCSCAYMYLERLLPSNY